jgi:hypothetical protein
MLSENLMAKRRASKGPKDVFRYRAALPFRAKESDQNRNGGRNVDDLSDRADKTHFDSRVAVVTG